MRETDNVHPLKLADVLDDVIEGSDGDAISVDAILEIIGTTAYGPLLILPALIAIAPTGAIPGMSIVTGSMIFLVSVQLLFSAQKVWLPANLKAFEFSRDRLKSAIQKAQPFVAKLDLILKPRLSLFAQTPFTQIIALICILLSFSMVPLALVPFAVSVPAAAVFLFGIGLTTNDGLVIIFGFVLTLASAWLTWCALGNANPISI